MESAKLNALYKKYELVKNDFYQHKHYTIITRQGIDKIQAKERIFIEYDVVKCDPEFCAVKASASKDNAKIQTFGSAKYGGKINKDGKWVEIGNTTTWYLLEMAEKRAMSRAVLKLTGFYELGVFGEDESEDFKKKPQQPKADETTRKSIQLAIAKCETIKDITKMWNNNKELQKEQFFIDLLSERKKVLTDNGITS